MMEASADKQKQPQANVAGSNPIYVEKLGKPKYRKTPRSIYFYYIGASEGNPVIRHYYDTEGGEEIEPDDLPTRIESLAINARLPLEDQEPPPDGDNWHFIVWTRKSYLVILIDRPNIQFEPENGLVIIPEQGANYSFFDAKQFSVPLPPGHPGGTTNAPVVYCINHMKRRNGTNDLERIATRYEIVLNTIPAMAIRLRDPDDGGTNMGPPVPPP